MSSKNNPENRGAETKPRTYAGKKVKPVKVIIGSRRYIAAAFENGDLVMDPHTKQPIPYQMAEKAA